MVTPKRITTRHDSPGQGLTGERGQPRQARASFPSVLRSGERGAARTAGRGRSQPQAAGRALVAEEPLLYAFAVRDIVSDVDIGGTIGGGCHANQHEQWLEPIGGLCRQAESASTAVDWDEGDNLGGRIGASAAILSPRCTQQTRDLATPIHPYCAHQPRIRPCVAAGAGGRYHRARLLLSGRNPG